MSDEPKIAGAPAAQLAPEPQPAPAVEAPPEVRVATLPPVFAPAQAAAALAAVEASEVPAPPQSVPAAPAPDSGVEALRAEVSEELEKARTARHALEAVQQRQVDKSRIAYLRQMGASPALSDEHLMTLAPAVDPGSTDGAAALQAWQQSNAALFDKQQQGATVTASIVEQFKASTHGTFGADFHQKQMRATFGGE